MVGMRVVYRVRLPPTIISRVGIVDRHHACVFLMGVGVVVAVKSRAHMGFTRQRYSAAGRSGRRVCVSKILTWFFVFIDRRDDS